MDDLFFAEGIDAMDVDGAALDDVEAVGGIAFSEEVFVLVKLAWGGDGGDGFEVRKWEA